MALEKGQASLLTLALCPQGLYSLVRERERDINQTFLQINRELTDFKCQAYNRLTWPGCSRMASFSEEGVFQPHMAKEAF